MHVLRPTMFFCVLLLTSVGADAQTDVRVRGTVTAFDGTVLAVKSRDGRTWRCRRRTNHSRCRQGRHTHRPQAGGLRRRHDDEACGWNPCGH